MTDRAVQPHQSPSLLGQDAEYEPQAEGQSQRAYELKVIVPASVAQDTRDWALAHDLVPDPHADSHGLYTTTTLYLDSPELDVYYKVGDYARRKLRIRRYGDAGTLHLERKIKRGERVSKVRGVIPVDALTSAGICAHQSAFAARFCNESAERRLAPSCAVTYTRAALQGQADGSAVRLTLDHALTARRWTDWSTPDTQQGERFLEGSAILELKFLNALPSLFRTLLMRLPVSPAAVSKYRLGLSAVDTSLRIG